MDAKGHNSRLTHETSTTIKLLLLGDGAVGKSSLMLRYCEDTFNPGHILTIGVDFKSKIINAMDERIKLQIWDTAGQERFRNITPVYFRSAMGVVLVFDVSSMESFESITYWLDSLEAHASPNLCKALVANKIDITRRQVSRRRAEALASKFGIHYYETSAMKNIGVDELFSQMATMIRKQQLEAKVNGRLQAIGGVDGFHLQPDRMELSGGAGDGALQCCGIKFGRGSSSSVNSVKKNQSENHPEGSGHPHPVSPEGKKRQQCRGGKQIRSGATTPAAADELHQKGGGTNKFINGEEFQVSHGVHEPSMNRASLVTAGLEGSHANLPVDGNLLFLKRNESKSRTNTRAGITRLRVGMSNTPSTTSGGSPYDASSPVLSRYHEDGFTVTDFEEQQVPSFSIPNR